MRAFGNHSPRILMVISTGFPQARFDEIRSSTPDAEFIAATDDTVQDKVAGVDALIGCPRWAFNDDLLDCAGRNLLWMHCSGAGVEEFIIPKLVDSDIVFTNGRVIQGPEIADHAMALLLALTRNLHLVISGKMDGPMPRPIELRGKTILVVGLGGIGMLIAERAASFGLKVLGVTADSIPPIFSMFEQTYPPEQLDEVLPYADFVIMSAPLTDLTKGMFGRDQFKLMKQSAYFVNVSRGKIVNTNALVEALQEGWILGAGLDVTDPEPLPNDHPLRRSVNVIITPHIAGLSDHNRQRGFELIKTNVERFVKGMPLLNVVNKKLGY